MFKNLTAIFFVVLLVAGCKKSDDIQCPYTESTVVAATSEFSTLQAYIAANHPTAIQHPSGFFYEITAPGTGSITAGVCSNVSVKYSGYLISNGTKFDENLTGITFTLGSLIVGWQKGIPLIKAGGSIILYLPPSLAYGSSAVGPIPANSYLKFIIQLDNVQ